MRARVLTVSVLAVPGTPSISACPSASKATRICSIGSSWPTITLRSSFRIYAIVEETYSGMGRFIEAQGLQDARSEEHTSELQSQSNLVCRLLLEKKKNEICYHHLLYQTGAEV